MGDVRGNGLAVWAPARGLVGGVADRAVPLHIFLVAGMHEVDAFAKGLIAVHYGPAEIVRHEPFGGFGFSARNVSKAIVLAT